METYKTIELESGKKVVISYDSCGESPREWDNLSTMVCFHNRYDLGDKNHNYKKNNYDSFDELESDIIKIEKTAIILPLYLYDHSGITISTTSFNCRWDSGQIGFIFVSRADILKEYNVKRISKKLLSKINDHILSEVKTYDYYLRGEIFDFCIFDNNGNVLDSCGGFYGSDFKNNGIFEYLNTDSLTSEEIKIVENELS